MSWTGLDDGAAAITLYRRQVVRQSDGPTVGGQSQAVTSGMSAARDRENGDYRLVASSMCCRSTALLSLSSAAFRV